MRRVALGCIISLPLVLLAPLSAAEGQEKGKVYRIGSLMGASRSVAAPFFEAFRQELRDLGWVEGQHFVMEYRWAEGQFSRFPALPAELLAQQVDVIILGTNAGTRAAMQATQTIPLGMTVVSEPEASGFIASLARPRGNVTGSP